MIFNSAYERLTLNYCVCQRQCSSGCRATCVPAIPRGNRELKVPEQWNRRLIFPTKGIFPCAANDGPRDARPSLRQLAAPEVVTFCKESKGFLLSLCPRIPYLQRRNLIESHILRVPGGPLRDGPLTRVAAPRTPSTTISCLNVRNKVLQRVGVVV